MIIRDLTKRTLGTRSQWPTSRISSQQDANGEKDLAIRILEHRLALLRLHFQSDVLYFFDVFTNELYSKLWPGEFRLGRPSYRQWSMLDGLPLATLRVEEMDSLMFVAHRVRDFAWIVGMIERFGHQLIDDAVCVLSDQVLNRPFTEKPWREQTDSPWECKIAILITCRRHTRSDNTDLADERRIPLFSFSFL